MLNLVKFDTGSLVYRNCDEYFGYPAAKDATPWGTLATDVGPLLLSDAAFRCIVVASHVSIRS